MFRSLKSIQPRRSWFFGAKKINLFLVLFVLLNVDTVFSADFEWSGLYRFEANHIEKSELDGDRFKDYGLHHLILKPKIVAYDGLLIYGRFDILNSDATFSSSDQVGQIWGNDVATVATSNNTNTNAYTGSQGVDNLQITNLYLTYVQEFGVLILGRAPLHFGLGMSYSAGDGFFDHWYNNRDMVGYKMVFGNSYFMPSIAKISEGSSISQNSDDVTEYNFHFQHENPDNDLELGIFYRIRKSSHSGNDSPTSTTDENFYGGLTGAVTDGLDVNQLNVYAIRDREKFKWALELGFNGGKTGVRDNSGVGSNVSLSGFGVTGQFEFRPSQSKWTYGLNLGLATGDDPSTTNKYEGFAYNRNYDVALLMFNHQLGQADVLKTSLSGGGASAVNDNVDVEAVSNVTYIAPTVLYKWKDKWNFRGTFITGYLNNEKLTSAISADKDLGYELDFELEYKPHDNFIWVNQVGYFIPGTAFEAGQAFNTNSALGLFSRVAISF